ncbi:MAG: CDP-glycerol glycerophosphotransferase family protein [Clostridia bacterium]|nr:CDP-glycerol glycerophosphotransferase family protein [Clostridia bacterium]
MRAYRRIKTWLRHRKGLFRVLHPIHRAWRRGTMRWFQLTRGINPRKVVFSCFMGESYSDNPRCISERLHELCPEAEIVWLFRSERLNAVRVPDYVRKAALLSRAGLREEATARFWVDNFRRGESGYLNDDKQYYINTWHGDRGFKRVGDDNEKLPFAMFRLEDRCAMMIAGSEFGRNTYRTAFHYKGEVLMDGCPKNDILLRNDPAEAADVRGRLGIDAETKILLYAPTYRDNLEFKRQDAVLDISATLDHLEARTGERWLCLYRAHYKNKGLNVKQDARVRDATAWEQMSELLLVSDMLITDYSSCGGDFALLRRPLFLYQADAEEYLRDSRSFYFRMEDSPFLVAHSQAELERLIDETDADKARENCEALDRFFGTTETGHATDAVCRYIMDRMG